MPTPIPRRRSAVPALAASLAFLIAGMTTGCGADLEPSERVSALYLFVFTEESELERNIMLVGEEDARASVRTETRDNCIIDPPCDNSADVEFRSSAPGVLSPARERVRTPAEVALVAHGPGTATLTATADGFTESRRIDVVSAPLPLDEVRLTLPPGTALPAEYDDAGSLSSLEVPVGTPVELHLTAVRGPSVVHGIPFQVGSSELGIVAVTSCDSSGLPTPCEVEDTAIHILAMAAGTAEITVSARNISTGFSVHVVETP